MQGEREVGFKHIAKGHGGTLREQRSGPGLALGADDAGAEGMQVAGNGPALETKRWRCECAGDAVRIPAEIQNRVRQWPCLAQHVRGAVDEHRNAGTFVEVGTAL